MSLHSSWRRYLCVIPAIAALWWGVGVRAAQAELKDVSVQGGITDGKAKLLIEAFLKGYGDDRVKPLHSVSIQHLMKVQADRLDHAIELSFETLQGEAKELLFILRGEGEILSVSGESIQDWSVRRELGGTNWLVMRTKQPEKPGNRFKATISAMTRVAVLPSNVKPLSLFPPVAALASGFLKIHSQSEVSTEAVSSPGLIPVDAAHLPDALKSAGDADSSRALAFRIQGEPFALELQCAAADPEAKRVVLGQYGLRGELRDGTAAFEMTATARVRDSRGGTIRLLSGGAALSEWQDRADARLEFSDGAYRVRFMKAGEYPIRVRFNALVTKSNDWQSVEFQLASGAIQPLVIAGLSQDAELEFAGSAKPSRRGGEFHGHLPPDGSVRFAWKRARPELESKLFYSAEMLWNAVVAQGVVKQAAILNGKVMQGELSKLDLRVEGAGDITRVQGAHVLSWRVAPGASGGSRVLTLHFNQPIRDEFSVQIHSQTDLAPFPAPVEPLRIAPHGATRFAGHVRVVNEGAVRLEVLESRGLSQISPEQFPESETTKSIFLATGTQRFAFRFSAPDYALRLQADAIMPELGVSQVLVYHAGENESSIEAELDVDVREAPVRELVLRVPKGYALAKLTAAGMSDYFLGQGGTDDSSEVRLLYGKPAIGRQLIQLRLERNTPLGTNVWNLPRVELAKVKSTRGSVLVAAEIGFRLNPGRSTGLVELATAFAPKKVPGIQSAFRMVEPNWSLEMAIERMPQTIQSEAFHLFSIGEGIAYGSSTIQYSIAGAPKSVFLVELSDEYANVEFAGKDVRAWRKTPEGYVVQLHAPVAGAYTLLATYERSFKSQGATLAFTGARPLEVLSEQGHTIVVSAYQFAVKPVNVSAGLAVLEAAEVPSEFRLFFDAPVLAAYRYSSRPFQLQLELSPLAQGDSLSMVVDRAVLSTRISKDGEVLTTAQYFLKNRGNSHLRIELPPGAELWSATIDGATVVPIKDGAASLLPLPKKADPNTIQTLELKMAARSPDAGSIRAAAPILSCPVLLGEWLVAADTGRQLLYRRGSLVPVGGVPDASAFAALGRAWNRNPGQIWVPALIAAGLVGLGLFSFQRVGSLAASGKRAAFWVVTLTGCIAMVLALVALLPMVDYVASFRTGEVREFRFVAPVQQAASDWSVELGNLPSGTLVASVVGSLFLALAAIVVWAFGFRPAWRPLRPVLGALSWMLLAWACLRMPGGGEWFFGLLALFLILRVGIPGLASVWRHRVGGSGGSIPSAGGASVVILISMMSSAVALSAQTEIDPSGPASQRASVMTLRPESPRPSIARKVVAESVQLDVQVEDRHARASVWVRWNATQGQSLPLLAGTSVLTSMEFPTNAVKWVFDDSTTNPVHRIWALRDGLVEVKFEFQIQTRVSPGATGFVSPVFHGLINRWTVSVRGVDVDVFSPQAVSTSLTQKDGHSVGALVTLPVEGAWIAWRPRTRDISREKAVFFAELAHLYAPSAGVIDGAHWIQIRPAQGELSELLFDVPEELTIADVTDVAAQPAGVDPRSRVKIALPPPLVSSWTYAPDARLLRVQLAAAQSRPFQLAIRSQSTTSPLPFEKRLGVLTLRGAEGQLGVAGVATVDEVQLDQAIPSSMSPINLEDYPQMPVNLFASTHPGMTLRRAFRLNGRDAGLRIKASAVEADVRVESSQTFSIGEDRLVLAANLNVSIARSGIFRLSFLLPKGMEIESLTGPGMSHWTELAMPEGRVVTMHLKGKTLGETRFAIVMAGAGLKGIRQWTLPRLELREASKQRGQLVLAPEQGIRLQAGLRDGLSQLDPQKAGIAQKGVLVFRILQEKWALTVELEPVDAWVQATTLQHVNVGPAFVRTLVNFQYQIENAGLKSFRVRIPTNAESVRFKGDQLADFLPVPGPAESGLQLWEVKLHRRVLGKYSLQATFQSPLGQNASDYVAHGVQAVDAGLQRGFLSIEATGRIQVKPGGLPAALQPSEWQSVPRTLQQDASTAAASYTYRLVDSTWQLPLTVERHEAAKMLPARVNSVTLRSVISDEGVMLTEGRIELIPGDKRLLQVALPAGAKFWYALVNQNGVWPWKESDKTLIPLEASRSGAASVVEIYYSSTIGQPGGGRLDLSLQGPKFDLPLENIVWQVRLNPKWKLDSWKGTLQFREEEVAPAGSIDLGSYLNQETALKQQRSKAAEEFLNFGNSLLEKGDPQQARKAFQSAFGLSRHDQAFNEDARVQLHNLKLQQAVVGLNVFNNRQQGGVAEPSGGKQAMSLAGPTAYTQAEAKRLMDSNTAEDNAAMSKLAERLIQQQDAAVPAPAALRASLPDQGKQLTFARAVQVDTFADLSLRLEASAATPASTGSRALLLFLLLMGFGLLGACARWALRPQS